MHCNIINAHVNHTVVRIDKDTIMYVASKCGWAFIFSDISSDIPPEGGLTSHTKYYFD